MALGDASGYPARGAAPCGGTSCQPSPAAKLSPAVIRAAPGQKKPRLGTGRQGRWQGVVGQGRRGVRQKAAPRRACGRARRCSCNPPLCTAWGRRTACARPRAGLAPAGPAKSAARTPSSPSSAACPPRRPHGQGRPNAASCRILSNRRRRGRGRCIRKRRSTT